MPMPMRGNRRDNDQTNFMDILESLKEPKYPMPKSEVKKFIEEYRDRYPEIYNTWRESQPSKPAYRWSYKIGGWRRVR